MTNPERGDKGRGALVLALFLWVSALVIVIIGIKMRAKPVLMLGLLDGFLAFLVTASALRALQRR